MLKKSLETLEIIDTEPENKNLMSIDEWKILIEKSPQYLHKAPEEIKDNEEIVRMAFSKVPHSIVGMSRRLKNDKVFMLSLLEKNIIAARYMAIELLDDKEIGLLVVKKKGHLLHYLSHELKADKEIVMQAVKKDVNALYNASWDLQNDKEVLLLFKERLKKQKINYGIRTWCEERLETLKIYEDEDIMKMDIEFAKKAVVRKF